MNNEWLGNMDAETASLINEMEEKYPEMTAKFKELCADQYITFLKKQHDYGPSNIAMGTQLKDETDLKLAMTGLTVRLNDKMSRLLNLVINKSNPKNESVDDTLKDMSVYAKIALIVLDWKWAK
ncbi:MAG: hypothetical protein JETCAE03_32750 [Ignavibacteriaceae bacterium]|jgi:hypothetical protein|nr:MAG: hypothetical protein JETCAE03_32750 [Ignavibacteriaceae bacterium]